MVNSLALRRALVSGMGAFVVIALVAGAGDSAGAGEPSKAPPLCAVLKTSLNGETTAGQNLNAQQVFAARQQTAANLSYYAKRGPGAIRSSIKTLANAYQKLAATGPPIDDQVDPTGADNQQAAVNQILHDPAFVKAINKIQTYSLLHLHCNLNP